VIVAETARRDRARLNLSVPRGITHASAAKVARVHSGVEGRRPARHVRDRHTSARVGDGRPDPRPTVRETVPQLGNLAADFDFSDPQLKPLLLPPNPRP